MYRPPLTRRRQCRPPRTAEPTVFPPSTTPTHPVARTATPLVRPHDRASGYARPAADTTGRNSWWTGGEGLSTVATRTAQRHHAIHDPAGANAVAPVLLRVSAHPKVRATLLAAQGIPPRVPATRDSMRPSGFRLAFPLYCRTVLVHSPISRAIGLAACPALSRTHTRSIASGVNRSKSPCATTHHHRSTKCCADPR